VTTPGEHRVRKKGKVINQKDVRLIKFIALERLYEKVCGDCRNVTPPNIFFLKPTLRPQFPHDYFYA
jgi:hypothetical protein